MNNNVRPGIDTVKSENRIMWSFFPSGSTIPSASIVFYDTGEVDTVDEFDVGEKDATLDVRVARLVFLLQTCVSLENVAYERIRELDPSMIEEIEKAQVGTGPQEGK